MPLVLRKFDEGIPRWTMYRALSEQMTRRMQDPDQLFLMDPLQRLLGYLQFRLDFERDRMEGNKTRVYPWPKI